MKQLFFALLFFIAGGSAAKAQGQELVIKYQFRSPEEKTKLAMEKLKVFKLSADAGEKTNKVLTEFYKEHQKMLDGAIKNGVSNVEQYKSKKMKLATDRDDKLKKLFSKEQFTNWISVIEPSLQPKRPSKAGS